MFSRNVLLGIEDLDTLVRLVGVEHAKLTARSRKNPMAATPERVAYLADLYKRLKDEQQEVHRTLANEVTRLVGHRCRWCHTWVKRGEEHSCRSEARTQ